MNRAKMVGRRIKRFRELAGLSKSDLARRVGVSPTAVHNWEENGVMPRMGVMPRLEKALEVDFMQLISARPDDVPEPQPTSLEPSADEPEMGRGDRLSQLRRQIAALFDVTPDRVDILIRA